MSQPYTPKQGQYLAFIHAYTKLNRQVPAEADFQRYFKTTPPTVHQMILMLERRGFIAHTPGQARSIHSQRKPLPLVVSAGTGSTVE